MAYINMVEKGRGKDREVSTLLNILHYDNSMAHISNLHNIEVENVSLNERQENAIFVYILKNVL
jgi:hypothetical protein